MLFGQNCPAQQSHGLFATAKLLVHTDVACVDYHVYGICVARTSLKTSRNVNNCRIITMNVLAAMCASGVQVIYVKFDDVVFHLSCIISLAYT